MKTYYRKAYKRIYIYEPSGVCRLYAGTNNNEIIYADSTHIAKQYKEGMAYKIASDLVHKYGVKVEVND